MKHFGPPLCNMGKLTGKHIPNVSGKSVCVVCLLLFISFVCNSTTSLAQPSSRSGFMHATIQFPAALSSHVDMVLVIDNVNEISLYDPGGARFLAAQLFVNQAQPGSRLGVVRVASSDNPAPILVLPLLTIQRNQDRDTLDHVLAQSYFGPVDPGPTAYFIPAFQTASQLLLAAQDHNSKYIIVMTDSLAQSGDQGPCAAASDQYHQWFCQIPALEAENISVIFFTFNRPDSQVDASQAAQLYLKQHGGMLFEVG